MPTFSHPILLPNGAVGENVPERVFSANGVRLPSMAPRFYRHLPLEQLITSFRKQAPPSGICTKTATLPLPSERRAGGRGAGQGRSQGKETNPPPSSAPGTWSFPRDPTGIIHRLTMPRKLRPVTALA